ncbi:hypothetical protein J6590_102686, partial [Homalodisca vitripennis]
MRDNEHFLNLNTLEEEEVSSVPASPIQRSPSVPTVILCNGPDLLMTSNPPPPINLVIHSSRIATPGHLLGWSGDPPLASTENKGVSVVGVSSLDMKNTMWSSPRRHIVISQVFYHDLLDTTVTDSEFFNILKTSYALIFLNEILDFLNVDLGFTRPWVTIVALILNPFTSLKNLFVP